MSQLTCRAPACRRPPARATQTPGWAWTTTSTTGCSRSGSSSSGSEVRDENANAICAQMLLLAAEDPDKDIYLYINSPGGSVDRRAWRSTTPCSTSSQRRRDRGDGPGRVDGPVPAVAPAPRASATPLPHARVMMHQPSGGIGGTASRHQDPGRADPAHQEADGRADRRAHRPDRRDRSSEDSDRDRWFTAEEAQEYGFVDHVVTQRRRRQRRRRHRRLTVDAAPSPTTRGAPR